MWPSETVSPPVPKWSSYLETIGKRVRVQWGEDVVTGTAEGVDDMGHLLLRRDNGALLTLNAGEVTLNTPAAKCPRPPIHPPFPRRRESKVRL